MHLKKTKIFLYFLLFFLGYKFLYPSEPSFGTVNIKNKNFVFKVEIADTKEKREKGLMFRTTLEPNQGMLFILPEPKYASVWMKNTILSLDII